jgi:hypothetical protein
MRARIMHAAGLLAAILTVVVAGGASVRGF